MNLHVLEEVVNNIEPRGGSSVVEINNNILIFGGVDREQVHFNSAYYFSSDSLAWNQLTMHGDIPTPRSGHAMASYGKYAFLFGGIDFMEELDYNDLYILDSESWEWKYVGEAGIEIKARNSHTLSIIEALDNSAIKINYLIIYGGASSEHGPLDDFVYALLPDKNNLDLKDIYVTWKEKAFANSPGKREMHSTASINGKTYITGGRNESGQLLSDVWIIEANIRDNIPDITCTELSSHRIPIARCAHVSGIVTMNSKQHLCLFGGFASGGLISSEVLSISLSNNDNNYQWESANLNKNISGRFGACSATISFPVYNQLVSSYNKTTSTSGETDSTGIIIFGGVDASIDYNTFVLIYYN